MAASYLYLRSLVWGGSQRVLQTSSCAWSRTPVLRTRSQSLDYRGDVTARFLSAQTSEVRDSSTRTGNFKKKRSSASSWEDAGDAFFAAKSGGDAGKSENSVERSNDRFEQNYEKEQKGNEYRERRFGNSRNAQGDSRERRWSSERDEDSGSARRQSPNYDNRRAPYKGRGFREEFSTDADDRRVNKWNARGDVNDNRSYGGFNNFSNKRSMYRGNSRNDAYEEDSFDNRRSNWNNERTNSYNDEPTASGGGSAFRRQFGSNVDTSKGIFQRGSRGGPLGKKQFPDADGGKRMFKGRFNGDGFVKKQFSKDDGGKKYFNGDTLRKGQSLSEQTSRTRVQRHSEDEVDDEAVSEEEDEEEDDDDEDFPQAGDVIRHSESVSNDADDVDDEGLIAEEMDEVERDEDVIAYQRRESRSFRKELPLKDSSLPKLKGEVLYGVGPVHAALQVSRREFFCLYVQQNMPLGGGSTSKKKDKKAFEWIIRSAIDRGLEVKELSKHDLNMLADNRPHQGLILDASPLEMVISTHLEEPHERDGIAPVWVALDEVTDPQNFGAILRSAYFLGAAGVVVCAKNSAPLSAVVSKASAGALEVMELRSCKNMMKFLDRSTENGWRVVGGAAAGTDVTSVRSLQRGLPTILVLGGEGKGLRTNVRRCCSELVCIPGLALDTSGKKESLQGSSRKVQNGADVDTDKLVTQLQNIGEDFIAVESLNVSVAAGILLHELLNAQGVPDVPILAGPVPSGEHNEGPGVDVELALSSVQVEPQTTETETVSINEHGHIAEANAYTLESVEQEQHVGIVASDIM